jgi:hypothetical protein
VSLPFKRTTPLPAIPKPCMHIIHTHQQTGLTSMRAFFLMSPSLGMCNYLTILFNISGRFDSMYPEQNLLNYAHRKHGNIP